MDIAELPYAIFRDIVRHLDDRHRKRLERYYKLKFISCRCLLRLCIVINVELISTFVMSAVSFGRRACRSLGLQTSALRREYSNLAVSHVHRRSLFTPKLALRVSLPNSIKIAFMKCFQSTTKLSI